MGMTGFTLDPLIIAIAAGTVMLVFVRGLIHKLTDHAMFRITVSEYGLLPEVLVAPAAIALMVAEAAVIAGLLVPVARPFAAALGVALLVAYGAAIAVNLMRGQVTIDCGCGGPGHGLSWLLVWRNAGLAGLAAIAGMAPDGRGLGLADGVVLVLSVLTVGLLVAGIEQAASNGAYVWLARNGRQ
jgi:hypothetical protein